MKVLIVDDHPFIRMGVRKILTDSGLNIHVSEAESANEVLNVLSEELIDLIVLDISLPGKDGLTLLGELKPMYPKIPIIILSIQSEDEYAIRALKLGAAGCVNKASVPEELISAIRVVRHGGRWINEKVQELLLNDVIYPSADDPLKTLSEREYQVMLLIASGNTLVEISNILCLSVKTVSTYKMRLLMKLKLHTNTQLVRYLIEKKIIT